MLVHRTIHIQIRQLSFFVLMATLLFSCGLSQAGDSEVILQVTSQNDNFQGSHFWLDGKLAGIVGDYIKVTTGVHEIKVKGPANTTQIIEIQLSKTNIVLKSVDLEKGGCPFLKKDIFVIDWPSPSLEFASTSGLSRILLAEPFTAKRTSSCRAPLPRTAGWSRTGMLRIQVNSEPPGAYVFVDGKIVTGGKKTPSKIVAPFHYTKGESEVNAELLLRKSGYVNCLLNLQVALRGIFADADEVTCILQPIKVE